MGIFNLTLRQRLFYSMKEFISSLIEATMDSLRKHGLMKTIIAICVLLVFVIAVTVAWQMPDLIRALNGR